MLKDALGNDLVINNWYGYSRNGNGITKIVVGKIKSIKPDAKKVYLHNAIEKRYMDKTGASNFEDKGGGVAISSVSLFPISDDDMIIMLLKN